MIITRILAGALCVASLASQPLAQPIDPFPKPIPATEGAIKVSFTEFASLPDIDGEAARMMLLIDEPGTRRLFVNDMRGILYSVSYDGKRVAPYLDLRIPRWSVNILSVNFEQGIQSFAFHPQFATPGALASASSIRTSTPATSRLPPTSRRLVRSVRTIRSCSNGPRRIPRPPHSTAGRLGSSCAFSSRS